MQWGCYKGFPVSKASGTDFIILSNKTGAGNEREKAKDKLLTKLEENEPELATSQEDECVICVNAKATMQTSPCGHRVVCRKCFVKTIQMAVSQRLLPLRCVICRAKILRLKQNTVPPLGYPKSWLMPSSASSYSMSGRSWSASSCKSGPWNDKNWVPSSASQYSMANRSVPNSASMYSMTSGTSTLSGMSSVSSATNSSAGSKTSASTSGAASRVGTVRQPTGSLRKSQQYAMKARIQEFNEPARPARPAAQAEKPARLPPIVEFQREYRLGKERASSSTRIRCAQKIVTQLETTPGRAGKAVKKPSTLAAGPGPVPSTSSSSSSSNSQPLKPANKDDKEREKSEERKATKPKEETAKKPEKTENGDGKDKKEVKVDKKKGKKEPEKKEEAGKVDKKDVKPEKKAVSKEVKNEKIDSKVEKGKN